jgi:hypothetical protein
VSTYDTRKFISALTKKGFEPDKAVTDHDGFILTLNGRETAVRTKTSRGEKEFHGDLAGKRRRQIHLSPKEFDDFYRCPMSKGEYLELLIRRKIVDPD